MQGEPYIQGVPIGRGERSRGLLTARSAALVAAPALLLVGVLSWPLFFTESIFTEDWINHLWFIWHQSLTIRANHAPSLFLNYSHAVFYPQYAFYGGTIDALAGILSLALGNAPLQAYILTYLLAFAAVYGGWYWMARMAGVGRWWAHAPGIVFITSAYYITSLYARGGWPEVLGVSSMPLMMASGISVLRAERLHPWPAIALVLSTVVFFGAHNITMLWGSTTLVFAALAIVVCVPQARRVVTRAGVLRVASLTVPAGLVSAWFLLPAVAYQSETVIGSSEESTRLLKETMSLVSVEHLFTISRASATTPAASFALSLPVLEIGWVLASVAIVLVTRRRGVWARMIVVLSAVTIAIGLVMTHASLLFALPSIYIDVQYSYRLESYVLQGLCGAILVGLVLAKGSGRRAQLWRWSLLPILAVSVVGAIQQTGAYPTEPATCCARVNAFDSYLQPPLGKRVWPDYLDIKLRPLTIPGAHLTRVDFPPASIHDDHASQTVYAAPGQLIYSNLAANPHMVEVSGAKIVGIEGEGNDVLQVSPRSSAAGTRRGKSAQTISVSTSHSAPIVAGRLLTLSAIAFLVLLFAGLAIRGLRERRSAG